MGPREVLRGRRRSVLLLLLRPAALEGGRRGSLGAAPALVALYSAQDGNLRLKEIDAFERTLQGEEVARAGLV